MAFYAIFNGLGRIIWGAVADRIGYKLSLFAMCLFQGIVMLAFLKLGATAAGLIACASIIGFNFGGNFSLFPTATAGCFGSKNLGPNYGLVFLAYGVAGIAGPSVASHFKAVAREAAKGSEEITPELVSQAWSTPFMIAGGACIAAAVIGLALKPPKAAPTAETAPDEGALDLSAEAEEELSAKDDE